MVHHGALHIVRRLPTHYQVVFARYDPQGSEGTVASRDIKGPTELHSFLEGAGVQLEIVREVLLSVVEKGKQSIEGLKLSDEDIRRLFPDAPQAEPSP